MMAPLVIDASVAIKWIVHEEGSEQALQLRKDFRLLAPELLLAECANILWKKNRRGDLISDQAIFAASLIDELAIETVPMRGLIEEAVGLSARLDHPAYDCIYLALAIQRRCRFVTADAGFHRKVHQVLDEAEREACHLLGPSNS